EDEAADQSAHGPLVRVPVLDPAQEAARDRDRAGEDVVEDLAPPQDEAAQQAKHERHDDAAGNLEPDGTLEEQRRQLHAASVTEIDSRLPSISALSASSWAPSNSSEVASVSPVK